ncbi:MAG: metallophosphoesterase [Methanoregulaceae archaeon]|jgi:metallophosphoesterase superfamily enzyme
MNLQFISDGPALLVQNRQNVLVIADLHFGIETDLAVHGWHFASRSNERLKRLIDSIKTNSPDLLILLGDVKHNIPETTRQEYRELPDVFEAIRDLVPFKLLPGNHDVGIGRFLQEGELLPKKGAIVDGVGYLHGHTIPSSELLGHLIVAGHHHPMVSLHDEVGCALRAPAYLLAELIENEPRIEKQNGVWKTTRVLFMPAFNEYAGFDILQITKYPFSPLSRSILTEGAEVFLTNGTYIGPASSLEDNVTT